MSKRKSKRLAIVIPIYKLALSTYEKISVDRCFEVLSNYDIYFIRPTKLDPTYYKEQYTNYKEIVFEDVYFRNIEGYNRLMLSSHFYSRFTHYEYILIYQTDAFVFKDNIKYWMDKNYDYIGGVWFNDYTEATNKKSIWLAGNGGLSLRKVKAFVDAIKSTKRIESVYEVISKIVKRECSIRSIVKAVGINNNVKSFIKNYSLNEDVLFAIEIPRLIESFTICPIKEALLFSYDKSPKLLYEYNNHTLPFGCHAWYRDDASYKGNLDFWSEIISIRSETDPAGETRES